MQRFYTLLTERAEECDWLRLLFLSVNGRRIAASFAAIYDKRLFLLKTGYDPEFARCSPFKLLTYFAVQYAFEAGLSESRLSWRHRAVEARVDDDDPVRTTGCLCLPARHAAGCSIR